MTDNTERGTDEGQSLLGRRSYLKVAAGAAALGLGTGSTAADESYDVIEVSAGDTYTVRLGDGDVLENTLIDITARNAKYQITAIGSGWEIRNVGVRGEWDEYEKAEPLIASVTDRNGTGRIENVYLGDGAPDNTYPGATGIYVAKNHAGVLEIDRVNIQDFPDNAIYGSSPGDLSRHSSGSGSNGEIHITNSYAANCRAGGFRVGSDGSYAKNCVAVGCDRNFWGFYNDTEAIDCDFSDGRFGDIGTGDGKWRADATVTVTNTRFDSTVNHSGRVVGSSAGSPRRTKPSEVEGVPLTPEEAASGSSGSSRPDEGTEGGDDETETEDETSGRLLAFVTEPDARNAEYEFTAEGPVELADADYESPSGRSISGNGNDTVEESDGTYQVSGLTGGGYGDAFRVDGAVTSIDIDQPDVMWVELDGERMSVEEVIAETGGADDEDQQVSDRLLAFVTDSEARYAEYEFTAEGPVELADADYESPSGGSIGGNGNDAIEESDGTYSVSGLTGGGYGDAFRVSGPVTSIDIDQPDVMWVELDGEEMSVEEVIDETSPDGSEDAPEEDQSDEDRPSNAIVIDATESGDSATYSFRVTGAVEKATHQDASIDDGDSVDGTAVEGSVDGSKDAYWFSGNIDDFWLNGDALVDVDYDAR